MREKEHLWVIEYCDNDNDCWFPTEDVSSNRSFARQVKKDILRFDKENSYRVVKYTRDYSPTR